MLYPFMDAIRSSDQHPLWASAQKWLVQKWVGPLHDVEQTTLGERLTLQEAADYLMAPAFYSWHMTLEMETMMLESVGEEDGMISFQAVNTNNEMMDLYLSLTPIQE